MFLHMDSEDSDQTGQTPRLICLRQAQRSFCWFCHEAAHLYNTLLCASIRALDQLAISPLI